MPDEHGRPYVYLAGPDVFYPDALLRGARMKEELAARGMVGLFPLDEVLNAGDFRDLSHYALGIAQSCETQMRRADLGIFNLQPWRGPEADSGTAYELGFMTALGKPVVLHTNDSRPLARRVIDDVYKGEVYWDGMFTRGASDRMMIEEFGLADNLMLMAPAFRSAQLVLGDRTEPAAAVHQSFETAADFALAVWQRMSSKVPAD